MIKMKKPHIIALVLFIAIAVSITIYNLQYNNNKFNNNKFGYEIIDAPEIKEQAENYVVELLGQEYFDNYVQTREVYYSEFLKGYSVDFIYNHPYGPGRFSVNVKDERIWSGTMPKKPYQFDLTKSDVFKIARDAGMNNPKEVYLEYLTKPYAYTRDVEKYDYFLEVTKENFKVGETYRMAIAPNGDIIGKIVANRNSWDELPSTMGITYQDNRNIS